jgi:carbonyl reductase 1
MKEGSRVALVTGGNRGIGLAIVRELARRGFAVVLGSRDLAAGRRAANALADEGLDVGAEALDVADDASVAALARALGDAGGGLDVLVNNAGIMLDGFDADIARRTVDVNFFGVLRVTDALAPLLRADARVVNLSSGLANTSDLPTTLRAQLQAPDMDRGAAIALMRSFVDGVRAGTYAAAGWPRSAYRVSKMGLNAVTGALARELSADGRRIVVNAACPGWVRTEMGGASAPRTVEEGARTPVWLATLPPGGPTGGVFEDERAAAW